MSEIKYIGWDDYNKMVLDVIGFVNLWCKEKYELPPSKVFDGVYGIPRGGLIPAVIISHRLGLPLLILPSPSALFVDDIVDSGLTLHRNSNCKCFAALMQKDHAKYMANIVGRAVDCGTYIVFPYESDLEAEKESKRFEDVQVRLRG